MESDDRTRENGPQGMTETVKQLAADVGVLVRKELELAKSEMSEKGKAAGVGAGMLSGSALAALLTLMTFTAFEIIAIALALPLWLAALVVTAEWVIITAVLALVGKQRLQQAGSLVPTRTIENIKEDVQYAQRAVKK